jgi:hypothetical protein
VTSFKLETTFGTMLVELNQDRSQIASGLGRVTSVKQTLELRGLGGV